jgi:hypothetical protein
VTARETADRLVAPTDLERISRAVAALDVVLMPERFDRLFAYQPDWTDSRRLATMDNGSGDQYQIVFEDGATVVRVFDHESELSPWMNPNGELADGLLDGLPDSLRPAIEEPSFRVVDSPPIELTFCAWWTTGTSTWGAGTNASDGGASELMEVVLDATPVGYVRCTGDYLERKIASDEVAAFYELRPATAFSLRALNPSVDVKSALTELGEMGYPIA